VRTERLTRTGDWLLAAVLVVFVFLAALYNILIPIAEGPDELMHIAVVNLMVQERRLPELFSDFTYSSEVIQPPLYYVLLGLLPVALDQQQLLPTTLQANPGFSWAGASELNYLDHTTYDSRLASWTHVLRLGSTIIGAATVWVIYLCGRRIWPSRIAPGILAASLAAFTPQFVYTSACVTNDILSTFWAALLTWLMLRVLTGDSSRAVVIALGIAGGLGALSKYTVLPVAALAVPVLLLAGADRPWRERTRDLAIFVAVAGSIAGWWFARNVWLYGDPTASAAMQELHAPMLNRKSVTTLFWMREYFLRPTFESYWGWFGQGIGLSAGIYRSLLALVVASAIGITMALVRRRERRSVLVLLCAIVGIAYAAYVAHNSNFGATHGRLLYPALAAITLLLTMGVVNLADGLSRPLRGVHLAVGISLDQCFRICVFGALVGGLLVVNLWALAGPIQAAYHLRAERHLSVTPQGELPLTAPLCCGQTHGQTFLASGRLMRIDVVLSAAGFHDQRELVFHLRDHPTAAENLRTVVIPRDRVSVGGYQRIDFAPIDVVPGRTLFFEIEARDSEPGGVSARYSAADGYAQGERFEGGRPAPGDLQFILFYND
jgi:hypothetical protein